MSHSLGIIEVRGIVTATSCIDAMVKSSYVTISRIDRVGSGLIAIIIKGDVASVQIALEIGREEATKHGEVIAAKVIPKPDDKLDSFISLEEKVNENEKV
ncbi:BMC domain-containing protein [Pseudogracilibacillus sp. SE30717A]|uniref:BMC domain-containing protein n=1 Tax=Pseudogracilibacillus sp. SE30717A TaxID=3098293 RepID=UPI00300E2061